MKVKINDIIQLAVSILLIIAATTALPYNYYVFLKWTIFILSIFVVYKVKDRIVAVIFISAVGILFNPILPFTFKKEIWHIIDFVLGLLLILSIDWKEYKNSLSPKGKLVFNLIKNCFWGTLLLIVAFGFVIYEGDFNNPYHEFLLITKATAAKGFITYSEEQENDGENSPAFDVYYEYTFTTKEGKIIKDHANDRSSESGYLKDANTKPITIEVEYISSDPQIHRIKNMTKQANTILDFLLRRIGLGIILLLMFCSFGFLMIMNAIKKYLTESKKTTANIDTK